jgi:hypothetical protein
MSGEQLGHTGEDIVALQITSHDGGQALARELIDHGEREVSNLKYLFSSEQRWTPNQANTFIVSAWNHVGLS